MALSYKDWPVSDDERRYVRARLIVNITLLAFIVLQVQSQSDALWMAVALGAVISVGTAAVLIAARRGYVSRAMNLVLIPDLVVIAGYTYLLKPYADGFYPVVMLLAIMYALIDTKREVQMVSAGAVLAYTIGSLPNASFSAAAAILFILKAASVPVGASMVATSVERQRTREKETAEAVAWSHRLNEEMRRRMSELQAVSQITEVVHSSLDFERVGPVVLEILAKVLSMSTCCLFVIDKDKSETLFSASIGVPALKHREGEVVDIQAVEDHFSCIAVFDHLEMMVLFCAAAEDIERLGDEDRLVLGAVASELVVAVENSRLYKLTKTLAVTDELTGLNNYRFLQQKLDEEIERARRYGKKLSMLMIDVDDFKKFNDSFGHIAGDKALFELAEVLRSAVREVDVVARYGGEEFSVVLPETDAAGAFVTAEKLREAVAGHPFKDADGQPTCAMTVSVGLATFPTHAWDKESLLREADDALYKAKNGGKNRVRAPMQRRAEEAESAVETPSESTGSDEWMGDPE